MKETRFYKFRNDFGRKAEVKFVLDEYVDGTLALYSENKSGRKSTISWYFDGVLNSNETYINIANHPKMFEILVNNDIATPVGVGEYDEDGYYPLMRFDLSKFKEPRA